MYSCHCIPSTRCWKRKYIEIRPCINKEVNNFVGLFNTTCQSWRCHDMEALSTSQALYIKTRRKRRALMISFWLTYTNCWTNSRIGNGLRCLKSHVKSLVIARTFWQMIILRKKIKFSIKFSTTIRTRPTLERRKTLGHLRSINPKMIIHFANQSKTYQLLKILKNFFSQNFMKRSCEKWCNQSQVELISKIHIDYRERHIHIYMYVEFLA